MFFYFRFQLNVPPCPFFWYVCPKTNLFHWIHALEGQSYLAEIDLSGRFDPVISRNE